MAFCLGASIVTGAVYFGPSTDPALGKTGTSAAGDSGAVSLEKAVQSGKVAQISPMPDGGAPDPEAKAASAQETSASAEAGSGGRTIDPSKPMVALTFDDGPYAPVGNQIMDCAEQYGARVTFFVVGDRVPTYATEVRRMAENGHEIGNHTMNHRILTKLSASGVRAQIDNGNAAVRNITGQQPSLVRPPGGGLNAIVRSNISQPIILWSLDTKDWKTRNADTTVQTVLSQVKDGDIILMHELYHPSGAAAVRLIPELTKRGYQLVTVSELAKYKGKALTGGKTYSAFR